MASNASTSSILIHGQSVEAQNRQPFQLAFAFDERQQRQADAGQEQTQRNQFRFAEHFHEPANGPALDERADEAAKDKQRNDRHGGFGFVHGDAKIEIVADQQRQGAFKTTERERRQEKNQDQADRFSAGRACAPIDSSAGARVAWLESGLQTFGENGKGQHENSPRKARRRSSPGPVPPKSFKRNAAEGRAEDESQPERHADQAHPLRAVFRRRDVGDVSLGDGDVAAARAGEHARDEQRPKRGGMIFKARPDGEQHIRQRRAGGADEHDGTAADAGRKAAPKSARRRIASRKTRR